MVRAWRGAAQSFKRDMGVHIDAIAQKYLIPGETQDTIRETIKFATKINPHTIQVSLRKLSDAGSKMPRDICTLSIVLSVETNCSTGARTLLSA